MRFFAKFSPTSENHGSRWRRGGFWLSRAKQLLRYRDQEIVVSGFISPRFIRYALIGVLNTLLFFILVNLLGGLFGVYAGLPFSLIGAFSVFIVIFHSYLWNRRWVFRSGDPQKSEQFVKFVLVCLGAMAINAGIVYVITTYIPPLPWLFSFGDHAEVLWANFAEAVSIVAIVIWNYCGFKFFVFREATHANAIANTSASPRSVEASINASQKTAQKKRSTMLFPVLLAMFSLLVGLLSIGPLLAISWHLERGGQPFVFSYENYRNDLTYLAIAREVQDGHSPRHDPFADESGPTVRNPLPPLVMGAIIRSSGGSIVSAYIVALFLFSQMIFLLFYMLARRFSSPRICAVLFSAVATLTPILFRILNFHGTP